MHYDPIDVLYENLYLERTEETAKRPPWAGWVYCVLYFRHLYLASSRYKRSKKSDIVYYNKEGKKHRLYGPAHVSHSYGYELWYKNGLLHRDDGPAVKHNRTEVYLKEGKLHRLDGPAVIDPAGPKQYWIDGVKYSPKQYKWEIERRNRKNGNRHTRKKNSVIGNEH